MKKILLFLMLFVAMLPAALMAQTFPIVCDFETQDFSQFGTYTNDAVYPWTVTSAQAHGGSYSMKSGNAGVSSSNTEFSVTVDFTGAGSVSFYCMASCESATSYWDYGSFYIDGVKQDDFLNTTTWQYRNYDLPAGQHTFKWTYVKDSSVDGNDDCFYVDDVVFELISCPNTSLPTASNITDQSAELLWHPNGTETNWDIYMTTSSTDVPDENTTPTLTVTDTFYNATGLNGQTTYYFYVRANCGGLDVSNWKSVSFMTSQVPAQLPFTCDFEDATQNSEWALINGTQTNKWIIGSAVNNTDNGSNALYISNDNGTTNAYTHTTSYVYAYRDIDFTQGAAAYQIDFDWRNQGESASYDYLKVYLGDPAMVTAGSSMPTAAHAQLLGTYYGQNTWQHATISLPSTAGGNRRLYFMWYNDTSGGSNPPAAVDNLSITALTCGFPTSFAIDTITSINATFHWHPATPNDNAWEVAVAPYGTSVDSVTFVSVNDTTYDAQALSSNTRYVAYVRTDCGMGDVSSAISVVFRTECAPTNNVPIVEDFEAYGSSSFPPCWTKISNYGSYPYTSSTAAHNGSYGLYFYQTTTSNGQCSYVVAPAVDPSVNMSDLTVRFDMKTTSTTNASLATLGIMSDPTDTATFTALYPVQLTTNWEEFEFPLTNYTGQGTNVALKVELNPASSSTYCYVYMDNFNLNYTPSCPRVVAITVDANTILSDAATITWTAGPSGTAWDVQVVPAGTNPSDNNWDTVSDTTYNAQGLTANTPYTVYVRTNCGNETSEYRSANFRTACGATGIPFTDNFESYTASSSSFPACWTSIAGSSYVYNGSDSYGGTGNSLKIYGPGTVATPFIPLNVNEVQISFQLNREGSSSSSMVLGFTTSLTDLSNMITIATIDPTEYHTMKKYEYNLNNINSTDQGYFVFQQQGTSTAWYYWLDNIRIQEIPDCVNPVVNIASAGSDVITLNWNNDMNATSWNVVYSTSPINPDTVTTNVLNVTDTFVTIDNLTPGQIYYFYVQTDCGSGTSYFSEPVSAAPGVYKISDFASLTTCEGILCDDGGLNGDYGANRNDQIVLYPATPGAGIQVSGTVSTESGYDYLYIYEGVGTSGTLLFEGEGTMTVPPVMSATALTIVFTSDNIVFYPGFALNIECVDCVRPTPNTAQIGMDYAQITWDDQDGTPNGWEVAFGPAGFNIDTVQPEFVSNSVYDALNLTSNTAYDVYVRTLCPTGDTSAWSNVLHLTTLAGLPAEVPYTCDFEDADENSAWMFANGTQTNKWYIGNAVNNTTGGDSALYISNNNGVSNAYTNTSLTYVWAYRDIYFTPASEYTLSFDWRAQGESSNYDYLTVYIAPAGTTVTGGNSSITGATVLFDVLNLDTAWTTVTFPMDATYSGTTKRLFFRWYNDTSGGTNPPAAVDNISITGSDCGRPMNVHAENVSNTSADIVWSAASSSDAQWEIEYGQTGFAHGSGTTVTANDTANTLSNLTPATRYDVYVRTNCGNNEYSEWSIVYTFLTECDAISTLPYTEQFENVTQVGSSSSAPSGYPNHEMPLCWSFLNMSTSTGTYPQAFVSNYSSYAVSGNCLFFKSSSTTPLYAVLPTFTEDIHNLQVTFKYRNESTGSYNGTLSVGYMTDPLDASTFVELYACPQITTITEVTQVMSSIPNDVTDAKIAFKYAGGTSNNYYASIDNVVVEVIPTCPRPTDVIVEGTTSSSVTLAWTENGSATSWEIEYGTQGYAQGQGTTVTATTNPFTINNLTAGTAYDFYVRATCSAADLSTWSEVATAVPGAYSIPTSGEHTVSMCGGTIYDDGGVNGDYSNYCNATVIVNPDQDGSFVQFNGTYNIETGSSSRWDYLQIFDGNTTAGTLLFDSHLGDNLTNITSTTGPLTILFVSDGSTSYSGFEIQVSCVSDTTPVEPCNAPANVTATNLTHESAVLDWTQEGTPDSWTISYKKGSADTWSTVETSSHPYTLTNLEAETSYSVYVTANCGDDESENSATITFVTLPNGVNSYVLDNTAVYPNPTTGLVTIQNTNVSIQRIEVYDVYGKLLNSVEVNDNTITLDVTNFASGVYFTRIMTENGMVTKRIVKK